MLHCTKRNFSIKDFFIKCNQIRSFLLIWSHLLKKSLMENFIFLQWCMGKLLFFDNLRKCTDYLLTKDELRLQHNKDRYHGRYHLRYRNYEQNDKWWSNSHKEVSAYTAKITIIWVTLHSYLKYCNATKYFAGWKNLFQLHHV